jgi:hypothetical protein
MTIPVLVQFNISDSLKISYLARPINTDRDYLMRSGRVGVLAHRRIKRWASTPILQVHFAHRAITISITSRRRYKRRKYVENKKWLTWSGISQF